MKAMMMKMLKGKVLTSLEWIKMKNMSKKKMMVLRNPLQKN
jgi:hypothetical protein